MGKGFKNFQRKLEGKEVKNTELKWHPYTGDYNPTPAGTLVVIRCDNGLFGYLTNEDGAIMFDEHAQRYSADSAMVNWNSPDISHYAIVGEDYG